MLDALPLPPRPNLEQYKKRAKELVKICKSGDRDAFHVWVAEWIDTLVKLNRLDTALPSNGYRGFTTTEISYRIQHAVERITKSLSASNRESPGACALTKAQFALAREHGFASWEKFSRHLEEAARDRSPISAFEAAVDAIVRGDLVVLETLLRDAPSLVSARSMREHHSTLLHYVSANGVESFRQRTPANIVEITERLLNASADVNAESEAYGGRSTALGLTATSIHPELAGVQLPLMDLLITHGANIDPPDGGSIVNACLRNGRGVAAEYLSRHGARLDLEGAAGVGRLDLVQRFFSEDGGLLPPVTQRQLKAGFAWACEFGRTAVAEFLSQKGLEAEALLSHEGDPTGLHWAAHGGHADIVRLLLERGAPVVIKENRFDGMPLDWAFHGWDGARPDRRDHYDVVALLARAGAKPDPEWFAEGSNQLRLARKVRSDAHMMAALRGEAPPP